MKPLEATIRAKLQDIFLPIFLEVVNESYMHNVPSGSETHFKITIVSESFEGKRQIQRHQAIYSAVNAELQNGVHAIALHTFSPAQWQSRQRVPESPQCLGGGKHHRGS